MLWVLLVRKPSYPQMNPSHGMSYTFIQSDLPFRNTVLDICYHPVYVIKNWDFICNQM